MKICLLAPEFLPNRGGVGSYCFELARFLAQHVDLTVLTLQRFDGALTCTQAEMEERLDHRAKVLTLAEGRDSFLYNAGFQWAVLRALRKLSHEKFDLIHSQHAHMPDLWSGMVRPDLQTVRTVHTTIRGQREAIRIAQRFGGKLEESEQWQLALRLGLSAAERLTFARRAFTITVSEWMRRQLLMSGFDSDRTIVIPTGVDTERFRPLSGARRDLGTQPGAPVVLFSGRPTLVKGSGILARAIPQVLERVPGAEFVFTGASKEQVLPLMRLEPQHVGRVHFAGFLPYEELPSVYASTDLAVVPTFYENLPIRILEAMACGLPVVASEVCGIPEAVTSERTGILVPPGSPEALAEAVIRLLEDREARRSMGREARRAAEERFSWRRVGEATLRAYEAGLTASVT